MNEDLVDPPPRCDGCDEEYSEDELASCENCGCIVCRNCTVWGDDVTGDWCDLCNGREVAQP